MMLHRKRGRGRGRAFALATWIGLPSLSLLAIAACAASDETEGPGSEGHVVIPSNDAGEEASLDATAAVDAPPAPCAAGDLCPVLPSLTPGGIAAISGRSKNDVWASGTGGLLLHYDGQQWAALESPIDETLSSLFLTSNESWGVAGTLVLRRGRDPGSVRTARVPQIGWSPAQSAAGVVVLSNEDVYLGIEPVNANDNYLVKLNFDSGTVDVLPPAVHPVTHAPQRPLRVRAVFHATDRALWLVGDHAAVARYPVMPSGDGGAPVLGQGVMVPVASQANLRAAWGQGEHLWAAGTNGTILHFDGAEWHIEDTGTPATLHAIFGLSPKDIWAAGDDGTVLHFDGDTWSRVGVGAYQGSLRAIWASGQDDVWVGGESGLFHWGALP